ncbi:hypothetical protein VTN49DRAFT_883 [Thermomyces lanuginosus]|uniref:uncharacterized protein n=1 Tax=Thermomyces lanuginosus TaxID=5541 RepID=UPI0037429C83
MPSDSHPTVLPTAQAQDDEATPKVPSRAPSRTSRDFFSIPAPIKRIFDRFPLVTYPANPLPGRRDRDIKQNELFVFIDPAGAQRGAPSYNPQCLRWQAYLKFVGVEFDIVPSNNHASPTGALPFLYPASPPNIGPIPSNKLQKWAIEQVHCEEEQQLNFRFDVYATLLDHRIRNAWLYQLYLDNDNFDAVARPRYIDSCTSNPAVRKALAIQLQHAARDELLKALDVVDVQSLEAEADEAFQALSTLLNNREYFFREGRPGLFDASVFSYTHLILDDSLGWRHNPLKHLLMKYENLIDHRQRLFQAYFA